MITVNTDSALDAESVGNVIENMVTVDGDQVDDNADNDTAILTTNLVEESNVTIAKTDNLADGETATAGGMLTYTVTVTNNGPSDATSVEVSDELPDNTTFVAHDPEDAENTSDSDCSAVDDDTVSCDIGVVAAGANASVNIVVMIDPSVEDGATLSNTASVDFDQVPNGNPETSVDTLVSRISDLMIEKEADSGTVLAGEEITYTLTATNNGPSDASNIMVTDSLPTGTLFTAALDGAQEVDPVDTDGMGTGIFVLDATQTELTFMITVDSLGADITMAHFHNSPVGVNGGVVRTITGDREDGTFTYSGVWQSSDGEPFNSDMLAALLAGELYINVHTTDNPSGEIRGQITSVNAGEMAFMAMLDPGQEVPPVDDDNANGKGTGWFVLNADQTELEFRVTADEANMSSDINNAHFHMAPKGVGGGVVRPINDDKLAGTYSGTWTGTEGDTFTADMVAALLAGNLYVNIHTVDHGSGEIRGQIIPKPPGVDVTGFGDGFDPMSGKWSVGDLEAGESDSIEITVRVPEGAAEGTVITNTASVMGDVTDNNSENDSASVSVTVETDADLMVTKIDDNDPSVAGGKLVYTITVNNNGPSDATGVMVTDTLPNGVTYVPHDENNAVNTSDSRCDIADNVVTCDIGFLAAEGQVVIKIVVTVNADTKGTIANQVAVAGDQSDANGDNNQDIEFTQIAAGVGDPDGGTTEEGESLTLVAGDPDKVQITVFVPADSVPANTEITVTAVDAHDPALPPLPDAFSTAFVLSPEGLTFDPPVQITFEYSDAELMALGTIAAAPVLLVDGEWIELEDCTSPDPLTPDQCIMLNEDNTITLLVSHFSTWGLTADIVKVVPINSDGELEHSSGDPFFVVVEAGDGSPSTTFGDLVPLANVDDVVLDTYSLRTVGLGAASHVDFFFATEGADAVIDDGELEIDMDDGEAPKVVELSVVDARSNRNYYLFPGINYMGLGLIPADSSIESVLDQVVPGVNEEFADALGRNPVLADVVETIFVFDPDAAGSFAKFTTRHPCSISGATCDDPTGGLIPNNDTIELTPFQGMLVMTRESVEVDGETVPLFASPDGENVPVKLNIAGFFLNSDEIGDPELPPTKQVRVGFNFIAPHVSNNATFQTVFAPLLAPIKVSDRADTLRKFVETSFEVDGNDVSIKGDSVVEPAQIGIADAPELRKTIEPEFAYWIFVQTFIQPNEQPARPTLVHTLVENN
jgi:uncharacterized repeat protein (TIGR01451 family)